MGRLKRSRISVRYIRVLNTDGTTKKYYEIEDKGKHLTLIQNPPENSQKESSLIPTELLLAANKISQTSQKQQNSNEIKGYSHSIRDAFIQSTSSFSELESSPCSSDAPAISSSVSQDFSINILKKNSNGSIKSSFAEEFMKIETFSPICSFLSSDSSPSFSCPSSPEINLDSDFTADEVPLNLDMYNNENLTQNFQWNLPSIKADQNDFGLNFPNFLTATPEEFPNLFSTW